MHPGGVTSDETRRPGRPRSARAERAILDAAVRLLDRVGYAGLTMEGLADEAGVGKTTIYRRYPCKADVVMAAIDDATEGLLDPDTGDVREDLRVLGQRFRDALVHTPLSEALPGLVLEAAATPDVAERFRSFIRRRRESGRVIIERGIERGQLRPDVDIDLVLDLFSGPLYLRLLVTGDDVGAVTPAELVDVLFDGMAN